MRRVAVKWGLTTFVMGACILFAWVFFGSPIQAIQCDGAVPKSFIPFGYNGSGCVPVPADWFEGNTAEQYADEPWVCLGMCWGLPYWDSDTGEWVDPPPQP